MGTNLRYITFVICLAVSLCGMSREALAQDQSGTGTTAAEKKTAGEKKSAKKSAKTNDENKSRQKVGQEGGTSGDYSSRGLAKAKKPGRPAGTPGEKDSGANESQPPK